MRRPEWTPESRRRLGRILLLIGGLAWVPYMIGKYLLGMTLPVWPFLTVHLCGVIPGSLLKRWDWISGLARRLFRWAGCLIAVLAVAALVGAGEWPAGKFFANGRPTPRRIALTFDDGPRPPYTSQVLEILAREKIVATFFMEGSQVEAYPEEARKVARAGHEIANHTYSHINLYAAMKKWRGSIHAQNPPEKVVAAARQEIVSGQAAIEKATGVRPRLLRYPHGYCKPWALKLAGELGYVIVNWSFWPQDSFRPKPEVIVERTLPHLGPGGIILLHDGGGPRAEMVEALPRLIAEIRKRNLEIVPVGALLGLPGATP